MKQARLLSWNKVFYDVNHTKCRYRMVMGGAGSGKSYNIAQDYIKKLSDKRYSGANLLVVRKVFETHRDSTFAELTSAISRMFGVCAKDVWQIRKSPLSLECKLTGNCIVFRGMNDAIQREKLKSITFPKGKLCWIWCEEATELSESDCDILDDRLRGELSERLFYQITFTFNPVSASHWIKRRYFDKESADVFCHKSTFADNRFIDADFKRRMQRRQEEDPEGYRVYALGEWGDFDGLILPHFEVKSFSHDYGMFDSMAIGQDFGFNHANAILTVGFRDGNIYVCDEIYEREKDTAEMIRLADGRIDKRLIMYCDSAEPDRIKMWRKAGYRAYGVKKEAGSVRAQIDWLKAHKLFIHPNCENTIGEISLWRWKKDSKSGLYIDEPVQCNDDAMAALRYAIEGVRRGARVEF